MEEMIFVFFISFLKLYLAAKQHFDFVPFLTHSFFMFFNQYTWYTSFYDRYIRYIFGSFYSIKYHGIWLVSIKLGDTHCTLFNNIIKLNYTEIEYRLWHDILRFQLWLSLTHLLSIHYAILLILQLAQKVVCMSQRPQPHIVRMKATKTFAWFSPYIHSFILLVSLLI